jgi:hypothetical protein
MSAHYKDQSLVFYGEIFAVYYENHTIHVFLTLLLAIRITQII